MTILLGAIADDFTGATDLANTLVNAGMKTRLYTGEPEMEFDPGEVDAVVVALKTRTIAASEAVAQSLRVLEWLLELNVHQVFFKYCSTFDSTKEGNIGPVADALQIRLGDRISVVCPAFPAAGRTIYKGNLFVGDILLSESSMKDHPLTPMTDSSLVRLMSAQSHGEAGLVPFDSVSRGPEVIRGCYRELKKSGIRYAVVDAISDDNLIAIGESVSEHKLVTGGSGMAIGLPQNYRNQGLLGDAVIAGYPGFQGRAVVLSGSCSSATRSQIEYVKNRWPCFRINIDKIAEGQPVAQNVIEWMHSCRATEPVLIYASENPEEVAGNQKKYGRLASGEMIEKTFAEIATLLREVQTGALVVAGGETSGAVISALGIRSLQIFAEIDPGVPWTQSQDEVPMAIALKSGNFGSEDFFVKSLLLLNRIE